MRPLSDIVSDYEQALGRRLTDDEKDHCFICQITGAWGFTDPGLILKDIPDFADGPREQGLNLKKQETQKYEKKMSCDQDLRYIVAKSGNPVEWHTLTRDEWIRYSGIIFCPDKLEAKRPWEGSKERHYCAQFCGRVGDYEIGKSKRYRVWLTEDEAARVVRKMAANKSLLTAVEETLGMPVRPLEKELIRRIMKN